MTKDSQYSKRVILGSIAGVAVVGVGLWLNQSSIPQTEQESSITFQSSSLSTSQENVNTTNQMTDSTSETSSQKPDRINMGWRGPEHTAPFKDDEIGKLYELEDSFYGYRLSTYRLPETQEEMNALVFAEQFVKMVFDWHGESIDNHMNKLTPYLSDRGIFYRDNEFRNIHLMTSLANREAWYEDSAIQVNKGGFYEEFKQYDGIVANVFGYGNRKKANGAPIDYFEKFYYLVLVKRDNTGQWKVDYFTPIRDTEY